MASSPFRPCDDKNMEVSLLCQITAAAGRGTQAPDVRGGAEVGNNVYKRRIFLEQNLRALHNNKEETFFDKGKKTWPSFDIFRCILTSYARFSNRNNVLLATGNYTSSSWSPPTTKPYPPPPPPPPPLSPPTSMALRAT